MLKNIIEALRKGPAAPPTDPSVPSDPAHRRRVAAAALLVEGARLDKDFDENERKTIVRLVRDAFDLTETEATDLVDIAEKHEKEHYSDWIFTKSVKEGFSPEEQMGVIQAMWEVAYADGSLHRYEAYLIEHVARELGLDDEAVDAARDAAKAAAGKG